MESPKKEFMEADKKFDEIERKNQEKVMKSNVELRKKIFMKISDVDCEDAYKFKAFCDRHFKGLQYLGIKYVVKLLDFEPLLLKVMELNDRVSLLENPVNLEEEPKLQLPKTQGGCKKKEVVKNGG